MANQITDQKMIERLNKLAAKREARPLIVFSDDQLRGFIVDAVKAEIHNLSLGYDVEIIDNVFDIEEFSAYYRSENCNVRDEDPETLKNVVAGMTVCRGLKGGKNNRIYFCIRGIQHMQEINQFFLTTLRKTIRTMVRHEFRHAAQFVYLISQGGLALADKVVNLDASGAYGSGILETDAFRFQNSDQDNVHEGLNEVFANIA